MKTFSSADWHEEVDTVTFTGKIWALGSWEGEQISVAVTDSAGNLINDFTWTGQQSLESPLFEPVSGFYFHDITLVQDYQASYGDITVTVTSTLDEASNDEAMGFGTAMTLSYSPLCITSYGFDTTLQQCVECHENCDTCYGSLESQCLQCFTDGYDRLTFQPYSEVVAECFNSGFCVDYLSGANGCPEYGCT